MEWYAVGEWKDFYVAVSGAAAAFAGLLFVGLSINLTRIISLPGISDRAGETLIFLGGVLVAVRGYSMLRGGGYHLVLLADDCKRAVVVALEATAVCDLACHETHLSGLK